MPRRKPGFPPNPSVSPVIGARPGVKAAARRARCRARKRRGRTSAATRIQLRWRVYRIRRRFDSKAYVGVTHRSIALRLTVYDHAARLRPRLGKPGTLIDAIRQAYAEGLSFEDAFEVKILAETSCPETARRLERDWIARLGTARPAGFNFMPGGASLGGPATATAVTLDHPVLGKRVYASLMDAVADIDRERQRQGKHPLRLGTIYARRAIGWSLEEALELKPHADGRRERVPFRWHGRTYETLDELARAEGLALDTLRSRLHRARRAGWGAEHDAAHDRRSPGTHRTGGAGCGLQPPLRLPHPTDPAAPPLAAADFARLSGLPRATVLHRYHRLADGRDPATLSRTDLLAALMQAADRLVTIALPLPGGKILRGGVRAVIREVLGNKALRLARPEQLGSSAIRARLRRIPGWPGILTPGAILWAFGFRPDRKPTEIRSEAAE